jgi:hypothetical protein
MVLQAHFFQDSVRPDSLGVEAMVQLLQYYVAERDMGAGLHRPRSSRYGSASS